MRQNINKKTIIKKNNELSIQVARKFGNGKNDVHELV